MNPDKISKFIYELRKEKNLSQYQLADLIPISRQAVSKWERGKTIPDTQTLVILSNIFEVSINELLTGERLQNNSIEQLEETTLSILDQSNKKTKKIKRITITSLIIIIVLLLSFLSYYFINSYNTIEVYKIGNKNNEIFTRDGILITTNEKYYLKLGEIKNKTGKEINNIKLYYKKDNKEILIVEDKDIDGMLIKDYYGYFDRLTRKDINELKNNLYLEVTFNETEKTVLKLKCKRDYNNSSLFFLKQRRETHKEVVEEKKTEEIKIEENKPEEKKEEKPIEEIKPTVQEEPQPQPQPEPTPEVKKDPIPEPPKEPEITIDQIIAKIKEKGTNTNGTYSCEFDNYNIIIIYYESMNKITVYRGYNELGNYQMNDDTYFCKTENCEEEIKNIIKQYLFS